MVTIVQNYAEAVYYWHNSTGIYAGCTGQRGVNLRTSGGKQLEVMRRSHASPSSDRPSGQGMRGVT